MRTPGVSTTGWNSPPSGNAHKDTTGSGADRLICQNERPCKAERLARLDHLGSNFDPLADLGAANKIDAETDRNQAGNVRKVQTATKPHCVVGESGHQTAVDEAATIGMWRRTFEPEMNFVVGTARVNRLPRIGKAASPRMAFEALRNLVLVHFPAASCFARPVPSRRASAWCRCARLRARSCRYGRRNPSTGWRRRTRISR